MRWTVQDAQAPGTQAPGGVPGRLDPLHAARRGLASPPRVPAPFGRPIPSRSGGPGEDPTPAWAAGLNEGSVLPLRSPYTWTLTAEDVLGYGYPGTDSVLHARVFQADLDDSGRRGRELPGAEPVVLLAQFGEHRGQSVTNSIERAVAAAQARFFPDGTTMRVVEMYPMVMSNHHQQPAPLTLREVVFDSRDRRSAARRAWTRRKQRQDPRRAWELALTVTGPAGVTRHVLPNPAPYDEAWAFTGPTWGRDLALEIPDDEHDAYEPDEIWLEFHPRITRPTTVRVPALLGDTALREQWNGQ